MSESKKQEEKPAKKLEKINKLSWSAPARPFKPRDRKYFTTIAVVILVLGLILLMVREFLLVGVLISMGFVSYVLATVKPQTVKHEISKEGVKTGNDLFTWEALTGFFFTEQWGYQILNIATKKVLPGRLMLLVGDAKKEDLEKELRKRLKKIAPPQKGLGETALEKAGALLNLE